MDVFFKILCSAGILLGLSIILGHAQRQHVRKKYLYRGAKLPRVWEVWLTGWTGAEWVLVFSSVLGWCGYVLLRVWG